MAGDEPAAVGETSTVITHAEAPPAATPQPRKLHKKAIVYLRKAALRRLKLTGIEHARPTNDFLQEGVVLILAKYGQPSHESLRTCRAGTATGRERCAAYYCVLHDLPTGTFTAEVKIPLVALPDSR